MFFQFSCIQILIYCMHNIFLVLSNRRCVRFSPLIYAQIRHPSTSAGARIGNLVTVVTRRGKPPETQKEKKQSFGPTEYKKTLQILLNFEKSRSWMFWVCVGSSHQHKVKGKHHGMEVIICQICMCALGWNAGSTWFRITSLYASPDHKIELPS